MKINLQILEEGSQLKRRIYKDDQKIKNLKQIVIKDLKTRLSARVGAIFVNIRKKKSKC